MQDVGCFDTLMYERVEKHCVRIIWEALHIVFNSNPILPLCLYNMVWGRGNDISCQLRRHKIMRYSMFPITGLIFQTVAAYLDSHTVGRSYCSPMYKNQF